jgi:plasmid stability protein
MANLTITVDEETLKRARIRAVEEGDSVNRYLAAQLATYAQGEDQALRRRHAADRFIELARRMPGHSEGRTWTRDELWEDTRSGLQ